MKQYVDLITTILKEGRVKTDRTGTGTISTFGHQSVFYMKDGFPLLTLKKTYTKGIIHELLWFLNAMPEKYKNFGNTNIKYLVDHDVHIWDEWAYAKYKKKVQQLTEPDNELLIEDITNNCLRPMTQQEFVETIKNDDGFAKQWGELGPVYGKQWTNWECPPFRTFDEGFGGTIVEYHEVHTINQINEAIKTLKNKPDDRGIMVSAWNVSELSEMALRPCHSIFQFITEPLTFEERVNCFIEQGNDILELGIGTTEDQIIQILNECEIPKFRLSLQLYQRSADTFLGVPFNIASYALLLHMVAQVVNMVPYKFVHTFGDLHLYLNHKDQVNEFLNRAYNDGEGIYLKDEIFNFWEHITKTHSLDSLGVCTSPPLPKLQLNSNIKNLEDFTIDDIKIVDYNPLSAIKAPVSV
jgi:thymidylate synthase